MPRAKRRYPEAIDDLYVDQLRLAQIEPYEWETWVAAHVALHFTPGVGDESERERISLLMSRMMMKTPGLPDIEFKFQLPLIK